jgi:anti-sigma factor RsiW
MERNDMNTADLLAKEPHQALAELLPWYVNGTLAADERQQVERHLRTCLVCKQELQFLHKLADTVQQTKVLDIAAEGSFASLRTKLQTGPVAAQACPQQPGLVALSANRGRRWRWVSVPLSAALLLLLVLIPQGTQTWRLAPADYYTLSAAPPVSIGGTKLHVVFADKQADLRINALLAQIHGQRIGEPNSVGAYTVLLEVVPDSPDMAAALAMLRAQPDVLFAEPIITP